MITTSNYRDLQREFLDSNPNWWYLEGYKDALYDDPLWDYFEKASELQQRLREAYLMGYEDAKGENDHT